MLQYTNGAVPENIHTHPKDGHWVSKVKLFKGKYEAKLEIPGGGGGEWEDMNRKTILGESKDIF